MGMPIVLPADVYDTLHFSALAFGGIGAGELERNGEPRCATGHLEFAGIALNRPQIYGSWEVYGLSANLNDYAVSQVNRRLAGKDPWDRIPFEAWCAAVNVVRGDS